MGAERKTKRSYPHLSKAPIEEALVDIQVQLAPDFPVQKLQEVAKNKLVSQFPEQRTQHLFETNFHFDVKAPASNITDRGVNGYILRSGDGKSVLQFRKNGFTFSRLRPYERWNNLRDQAMRWWELYEGTVEKLVVLRIALRYINQLSLPELALSELDKYLVAPPKQPKEAGFRTGFESRVFVRSENSGRQAIITQILNPIQLTESRQFILDIDSFFTGDPEIKSPAIWDMFEDLHDFKNLLFFRSLKRIAWEQYR